MTPVLEEVASRLLAAYREDWRYVGSCAATWSQFELAYSVRASAPLVAIWHPMSEPPPGAHCIVRVLVTWRDRATREYSSGELFYLHDILVRWDEDDAEYVGSAGAYRQCTGWFDQDKDGVYLPISEQFVEHLGWTHMPVMPDPETAELLARLQFVDAAGAQI